MNKKWLAWVLTLVLSLSCTSAFAQQTYGFYLASEKMGVKIYEVSSSGKSKTVTNAYPLDPSQPLSFATVEGTYGQSTSLYIVVSYTTKREHKAQTRYIKGEDSRLVFEAPQWADVSFEGSFEGYAVFRDTAISNLRVDGGTVLLEDVSLTGLIVVRGNGVLILNNCTFADDAQLAYADEERILFMAEMPAENVEAQE